MADYFVLGDSGDDAEGPVDLETLRTWSREGRITPKSKLRDVDSGAVILAGRLRGLDFVSPSPKNEPDFQILFTHSPYPRKPDLDLDEARHHIRVAWLLNVLGLVFVCCCGLNVILFGLALYRTNLAKRSGSDLGLGARIFAIIGLGYSVFSLVTYLWSIGDSLI